MCMLLIFFSRPICAFLSSLYSTNVIFTNCTRASVLLWFLSRKVLTFTEVIKTLLRADKTPEKKIERPGE